MDNARVPIAYRETCGPARECDAALTEQYLEHALIGDADADAVVQELAEGGEENGHHVIHAALEGLDKQDEQASAVLKKHPALEAFRDSLEQGPEWLDHAMFRPGIRLFTRKSRYILAGVLSASLIENFSTNISKSFFITGRLRDQGVRRLKQNIHHIIRIFMPGGLMPGQDGWLLSVRARMVHAQVRRLLLHSDEWQADRWGTPLSAAHMGFALSVFSARLLQHLERFGVPVTEEERESFVAVWRYTGFLMGIPEAMLPRNAAEALKLHDIAALCEPAPDFEAIAMANAVINGSPIIVGKTDVRERREFADFAYKLSRTLIGDRMADSLRFPKTSTRGALAQFRLQDRCADAMLRINSKWRVRGKFPNFTRRLDAAMFEHAGITWRLPSHLHSEQSEQW